MAPSRGSDFGERMFFVYDREAVQKESDPPEDAILYFYPTSVKVDQQVSICGQLIGMVHFTHSFLGTKPMLYRLRGEKVATRHSGRYSFALGGSLDEPDSFLIRQLETLCNVFSFYHGSLKRVAKMSKNQEAFLSQMDIIWDCYLPFIRHYGDNLPQVFHPLPFLDLPKRMSAACFLRASHILQACQRRQHVIGGCILYKNRILCSELEPSLTSRLLLLKPNQSHLPARPVKTDFNLPFGVRILSAFVTLSEYFNLYDALAQSPYRQNYPDNCYFPGTSRSQTPEKMEDRREQKSSRACTRLGELADYSGTICSHFDRRFNKVVSNDQSLNPEQTSSHLIRQTVEQKELPAFSVDIEKHSSVISKSDCLSAASQDSTSFVNKENAFIKRTLSDANCIMAGKNVSPTSFPYSTGTVTSKSVLQSAHKSPSQEDEECRNVCEEKCKNEGSAGKKRPEVNQLYKKEIDYGGKSDGKKENLISSKLSFCDKFSEEDILDNFVNNGDKCKLNPENLLLMDKVDTSDLRVVRESCNRSRQSSPDSSAIYPEFERTKIEINETYKICSEILDDVVTDITKEKDEEMDFKNYRTFLLSVCVSVVDDLIETVCRSETCRNEKYQDIKIRDSPVKREDPETASSSLENCLGEVGCSNNVFVENGLLDCESTDFHETEYTAPHNVSRKSPVNRSSESSVEGEDRKLFFGSESTDLRYAVKELSSSKFAKCKRKVEQKACIEEKIATTETDIAKGSEKLNYANSGSNTTSSYSNSFGTNPDQSEEKVPSVFAKSAAGGESLGMREFIDNKRATNRADEAIQYELGGEDINKVEDMVHINLYVQAHSEVVLILLADVGLQQESTIKALWETSLSSLGELEFHIKEALAISTKQSKNQDYSFLVYNNIESTMKGNLKEPVMHVEHMFCDMAKHMHEQFTNSESLKDITLRSQISAVHGKRTLGRETYFQQKGFFRAAQGVPSPRDPAFSLEKRAGKVLNKEHGVNVF